MTMLAAPILGRDPLTTYDTPPSDGSRPAHPPRARDRRVTIRDVAADAEVSVMTVSNAVNGRLSSMSPQTHQRIKEAIARLGYRPQTTARNLRLARHETIGVIVVSEDPAFLADPFVTQIVAGLSNQLGSHGYAAMLQGLAPEAIGLSRLVRNVRTDGLCAMLSGSPRQRESCRDVLLGVSQPLVLFQETLKLPEADTCLIRQDDHAGGRLVCGEVLDKGARDLVMLVPKRYWPAIGERVRGVKDLIRERKSQARLTVVKSSDASFADIQSGLSDYLDAHPKPDAVLAGNDQIGIAAMKLLASRGLKVPADLLLTGFNAFDFWQYTDPVLTTVRSPAYAMGARGAEEMLERLRNGAFATREIVYPVDLQRGGST